MIRNAVPSRPWEAAHGPMVPETVVFKGRTDEPQWSGQSWMGSRLSMVDSGMGLPTTPGTQGWLHGKSASHVRHGPMIDPSSLLARHQRGVGPVASFAGPSMVILGAW
jgi:hypothetical protein